MPNKAGAEEDRIDAAALVELAILHETLLQHNSLATLWSMKRYWFVFLMVFSIPLSAAPGDGSKEGIPGCRNELVWGVPVRVVTTGFKAVQDLKVEDFSLAENRSPRTLCGFIHRREPSSIGILLDASGSMGYRFNALAVAVAGIKRLLDTSGPEDEYFLEYGNGSRPVKYSFTRDQAILRAKLQVRSKGKTSLIDSICQSLDSMSRAHHLNRALLVFSDGYDNASTLRTEEIARLLAASPVPIFLVIPFDPMERVHPSLYSDGELDAREQLSQLSGKSGGGTVVVSGDKEILKVVTEIADVIRSPYLLYFDAVTNDPVRIGELQIQVGRVHPRLMVLYRGARRYRQQPPESGGGRSQPR